MPSDWNFADNDAMVAAEIHLAGSEQRDENGLVVKEILREGEWPVIPTNFGRVKKPLRVVRNGRSDKEAGVISMEELVANFEAGAIPNVQIPLSDEEHRDHKNTTRVNTGFVRGLRIEDKDDGARLVADMEFTEPDVRDKTLRGTYADVSCGIPWGINSRGKEYGPCLEHVAITNKPFIDKLGPFLAMSADEQEELQVDLYSQTMEVKDEKKEEESGNPAATLVPGEVVLNSHQEEKLEAPVVSYETTKTLLSDTLNTNFNLSGTDNVYRINDLTGTTANITSTVSDTTWTVPYYLQGTSTSPTIHLGGTSEWTEVSTGEEIDEAPVEQKPAVPRSESPEDELQAARRLREIRLSDSYSTQTKEKRMPLSNEELDRLELSDETRAALQDVLNENADLQRKARERDVEKRIDELKELGLNERPSALKLYRSVMLSDDGGPAIVLLSDDGKEKEQISALEILDRFIEGVKGSDEKVVLSDQALVTGDDEKPPADASGEAPVEERVAKMKAELGIKS
jgi:hypothetical protein